MSESYPSITNPTTTPAYTCPDYSSDSEIESIEDNDISDLEDEDDEYIDGDDVSDNDVDEVKVGAMDDEGNDSSGVLDNTSRNRRWTAEEDAIILRERENGVHSYATRSAKRLKGRSVEAVQNRWLNYLKKHHAVETQVSTAAPKTKKTKTS